MREMSVLLDTNAFLWALEDAARLSSRARTIFADAGQEKVVSVAVFWEMTIKASLGKLRVGRAPDELMASLPEAGVIRVLPIEASHLRRLGTLPHHHRDPFDRLMIAQALEEGLEVVSSDDAWDAYGVTRIW